MSEYIDDENTTFGTDKIYIRRNKTEGKGVFAKEDIKAHDLIERFSLIPLHYRTLYQGDNSLLRHAIVRDDCPCEECKKHGSSMYIAQGYASAYTYADDNRINAEYKITYEKYYGLVLAVKDIKKDQEIIVPAMQSYHYKNFVLPQLEFNQFREEQNNEIGT